MAVDAVASGRRRDATFAVDEEVAVPVDPATEVDKKVAGGLAAAAELADVELVVRSVKHADRLAAAAVALEANLEKLGS